jgi:hypothetical protein
MNWYIIHALDSGNEHEKMAVIVNNVFHVSHTTAMATAGHVM